LSFILLEDNFFKNAILIRYGCSQISGVFHPFEGYITYLYVVILSCMLVSRHDHILCFPSIYFWTNLLTSDY
jgi:hypothetical protein